MGSISLSPSPAHSAKTGGPWLDEKDSLSKQGSPLANKAHLQPILMHMPRMTMVIVERRICHQVTSKDISSDLIQIVHVVNLYN